MEKRLFTSESVTEGHPDKICDNISDGILDALMEQDPMSRVACETAITTDYVLIMGEITTKAKVDYEKIARETIREIGYDADEKGFNCDTCRVKVLLDSQSPDIAMGVDKALEARENDMSDEQPYLRADCKSQVTIEYDENDKPVHVNAVVISTQHAEEISQEQIHEDIKKYVIDPIVPAELIDETTKVFINPTGRFVIGGPNGDSGLTGRKIIVDTYGGYARHGGGAFSGKDCTKVDRSAAYAARYVAKNIVAAGLAKRCEIQLSYAIGVAQPTSVMVDTFGTGKLDDQKLVEIIREKFDLRPAGIIKMLDLRRPIYKQTAAYGHFGRNELNLPWEQTDKAEELRSYL